MSEYIVTGEQIEELNKAHGGMQILTSWLSAYAIFDTSEFPPLMKSEHLAITLPSVVRCRDCKHFTPRGTHKFEDGKENEDYCDYVRGWMLQITPDGFCAWGERRER